MEVSVEELRQHVRNAASAHSDETSWKQGRDAECACTPTAGTCRALLTGEAHLGSFVRIEGIEPTHNEAERSLRHVVRDRKTSGGTDREAGDRFVERILTVVATGRQQEIHVLE